VVSPNGVIFEMTYSDGFTQSFKWHGIGRFARAPEPSVEAIGEAWKHADDAFGRPHLNSFVNVE
jgi:hypothetical protein